MTKKNPWTRVRLWSQVALLATLGLIFVGFIVAVIVQLAFDSGWGWWAALWFPLIGVGIVVALSALFAVCEIIRRQSERFASWWREREYTWNDMNDGWPKRETISAEELFGKRKEK